MLLRERSNMKVLVTGATGFLGFHLCRALKKRGYQVTALRRATSDVSSLTGLDLDFSVGDVTDPSSLELAIRDHEMVIHAAGHLAYWSRLRSIQNQINIEGTRNVINVSRRSGVRRLIFVSSVAAIGIPARGEPPADETFPFNLERGPLNYPISKKRAEELVLASNGGGLESVIVNPGALFGEWGKHFRGSEWVDKIRHRRLAFYFTGGRNLVHVEDVAKGMINALERGRNGERYILGGENLTHYESARMVAMRLKRKVLLLPVPSLVTGSFALLDPLYSAAGRRPPVTREVHYTASRFQYYNSDKAKRELGYHFRPFADIIEEIVNRRDQSSGAVS